eukprot:CAMPEP_0197237912 /NCGR_PEP_ID=MMETSP1429-20130617/4598_1 /TAXON_ID=49237 /ORGANISM="Chaetoceros  sp., Strain UNC1202" /LENGTH=296 /DNA_ID=CAMNT_0042696993 /DNA_START=94 /DNA_END=984 /DNA_ORIENTATION=+
MIVGYSLSPGGLLFPWHIGVLAGLAHENVLTDSNPLAGSSAGSIAVASHGAGVRPEVALEATIRMSDECRTTYGGARGNLLPLLENELGNILDDDVHEVLNQREGFVGLAYRELLPNNRPVLDTLFDDKSHVIDSVCNSSMFPFFSTNWPCRFARKKDNGWLPRVAVDGYFSVDRDRFGCPDIESMEHARMGEGSKTDRTVTVSVFPHDVISLSASEKHDQISPLVDEEDATGQMSNLLRLATQCATREDYYQLYEDGWKDAERWVKEEEERGYWGANTSERRRLYGKSLESDPRN